MRLTCSTASFPQDRLEIAIAKVAWAGYEGVELVLEREPLPPEEGLARRLLADELELCGVAAGVLPVGTHGVALDELARIGRAAVATRTLDGGLLILEAPLEGSLAELAQVLRMLHTATRDIAVDLCIVNRSRTLVSGLEDLAALWRQPLPGRVGIALDPAHALLSGWDPLELDQLPQLPRQVYLNDASDGRIVPPGEGELDLSEFGSRLRQADFRGPVCLRLENADAWNVEPTAREVREAATGWLGI